MDLVFNINGAKPDPHLGIIEGYILEGINQLTTIELVLVSPFLLSDSACADYIGQSVSLGLVGLVEERLNVSRFDGRIYEFHVLDEVGIEEGLHKYQMIVRPRIWDLNFFVRARSFPNRTRVDVVDEILVEHGFLSDHHYKAMYQNRKAYPEQPQLIQNQVSDLVFLQNLLREAGINYYFAADKQGEKETFLKLTDNNIFFDDISWTVVPYIPDSGQVGGYRIESFETHYRAVPKKTVATSYLGDGKPQVFTSVHAIADGTTGEFHCFGTEGESCDVSKRAAMIGAQHFQSSRILYEGRSNQFIFRPGEKFKVGDQFGAPRRNVLMTTLFHHFHQTAKSAVSEDHSVEYHNYFCGTEKLAEIRPDQTDAKTIVEMKRLFSSRHSWPNSTTQDEPYDIEDLEKQSLRKRVAELKSELVMVKDMTGVMVGEVVEDAKVTENNELVCIVKNEKFPDGITVKIALGWLSQQGWLSLLPRVGVQVYFQFIAGTGGQHEAVLIGYRPTSDHPLMNPAKNIESDSLDPDDEKAVGEASFSPLNKHRNALMGEHGVAEIAVVDGGEDSVYLKANNRVSMNGDKSVSIKTKSLREKVGGAHQQYGSLKRVVSKNQTVDIGKDLERNVEGKTSETTQNEVSIISTKSFVSLFGATQVYLHDVDGAFLDIRGNKIKTALKESSQVGIELTDNGISEAVGDAKILIAKKGSVYLTSGKDSSMMLTDKRALVKAGESRIEIKDNGNIELYTKGEIKVEGKNVKVKAEKVLLDGGGGKVDLSGSEVKLNC